MNWQPYPRAHMGQWAEHGTLILSVMPSGSWAVFDTSGKVPPRSSDYFAQQAEPMGVEAGKQQAEAAARDMAGAGAAVTLGA